MKAENMMKWILSGALACSLIAFSACSKSEDGTGQETPATSAQQNPNNQPNNQATPGPDIPDEDVPVETDFEEAAEKEITADNYQQELDKLEKAIAGGS
jgi:hypothetical protein